MDQSLHVGLHAGILVLDKPGEVAVSNGVVGNGQDRPDEEDNSVPLALAHLDGRKRQRAGAAFRKSAPNNRIPTGSSSKTQSPVQAHQGPASSRDQASRTIGAS